MSYQEFKEEIIKRLKQVFPETTQIAIHKVRKNNNLKLDSLSIIKENTNLSPNFYLNYYYEDYLEHKDIDRIIKLILETYNEYMPQENINIDCFTNFEIMKKHLAYKIVNFERNKELLKEIPHIPYLDLAIVFYCVVQQAPLPMGSILIRNEHLAVWDITDEELYHLAIENTPKLFPYHLINIRELFPNLPEPETNPSVATMSRGIEQIKPFQPDIDATSLAPTMYILSNEPKTMGAASILYLNLLEEISNRFQSSFYVLPSSVHEVILVPDLNPSKLSHYTKMVQEVNENCVYDDELLSDHAYYYSYEEKALMY